MDCPALATQKRSSHEETRISRRIRQVTEGFNILAIIGEVDRSLCWTNEPDKQQIGVGQNTEVIRDVLQPRRANGHGHIMHRS